MATCPPPSPETLRVWNSVCEFCGENFYPYDACPAYACRRREVGNIGPIRRSRLASNSRQRLYTRVREDGAQMSIKVKLGQLGPSYTLMVKSSDKVMWFIQTAAAMHLDSIPDPLPEGASVNVFHKRRELDPGPDGERTVEFYEFETTDTVYVKIYTEYGELISWNPLQGWVHC